MSRLRDCPAGFVLSREGRWLAAVRAESAGAVLPLLRHWAAGALPPPVRRLSGGRGGVGVYQLAADLAAVVRSYRRGGWVARCNRDIYCGWRPRPLRELAVTEALRARGVPTVEILGAAVRWVVPGCYRGVMVSREVPGAHNLWEYLCAAAPAERSGACAAAASVTRQLHDAGVIHPDLNLQNYLVRRLAGGVEVRIIDLDRARLQPVSAAQRRAAAARLRRSVRRLDPLARVITADCQAALQAVGAAEAT
ncbi:MAG: hypothetical protein HY699_05575 [Deltaproteobacteria bacterium]|nr:hypothetical protein [Deltaproteobacteria bacterium]